MTSNPQEEPLPHPTLLSEGVHVIIHLDGAHL